MSPTIKDRFDLTGKVAIVTGASKGIGAAIARGLAEFGAKVVVSSRKQAAVDDVAARFAADGLEATAVAAHIGSLEDIGRLVDRTVEQYGGIDIVVNNAATNPVFGPAIDAEPAVFDKIFSVNVRGPFELSRRAFASMQQRGGGSVINIASVGGLRPEKLLALYSTSKTAIVGLTKALAAEWGAAGVRVNVICPGLVKTKFSEALWSSDEILQHFLDQVPLGRIGQPEDIAPMAVFLASDAGAYCTGGVFLVDGGHVI